MNWGMRDGMVNAEPPEERRNLPLGYMYDTRLGLSILSTHQPLQYGEQAKGWNEMSLRCGPDAS